MRAVIQRVSEAEVSIAGDRKAKIGQGLVILIGVGNTDSEEDSDYLAKKCSQLRIFPDLNGKFNRSALHVNAEILIISQFTLYGDCRRGRRPSFTEAARPEHSEPLYESFITKMGTSNLRIEAGKFGATMLVRIFNDGPVTIILDSKNR